MVSVVAHTYNPSTWGTDKNQGQPQLQSEFGQAKAILDCHQNEGEK